MTFLFGASSMLGWSVLQVLPDVVAFCNGNTRVMPAGVSRGIHLNDEAAVAALFAAEGPSLVINCSGVCDITTCETSPEFAEAVNVDGTRNLLAHAPPETRIVHVSSDHVFSGDTGPYHEHSPPDPISVYGRTRVAAEALVLARPRTLVVRPGLWIGPSGNGRLGHLDWLRYRHGRALPMTIVADEARSAVWAPDAARRIVELAASDITGIRHITTSRAVDRPRLAAYLNDLYGIGAHFAVETRRDRPVPHLGCVELATCYGDVLASPLTSVVPDDLQ